MLREGVAAKKKMRRDHWGAPQRETAVWTETSAHSLCSRNTCFGLSICVPDSGWSAPTAKSHAASASAARQHRAGTTNWENVTETSCLRQHVFTLQPLNRSTSISESMSHWTNPCFAFRPYTDQQNLLPLQYVQHASIRLSRWAHTPFVMRGTCHLAFSQGSHVTKWTHCLMCPHIWKSFVCTSQTWKWQTANKRFKTSLMEIIKGQQVEE